MITALSVWAPSVDTVDVATTCSTVPMSRDDRGWWSADVALPPDGRYGFVLDGESPPRPDPRSRCQPDSVHGLSAWFDPHQYEWHDASWEGRALAGQSIYELHVGTFTAEGTLDAAIERLPHLAELGIGFVEIMPVNAFDGDRNWGYDGVLWFAVDETYGGPAAYQRFVDACHVAGLGVLQDVVYNHLGPSGNHLPRFGPYEHQTASSPWGAAIALDEPEVRRYILDNAAMWLRDYHVDGLRLDAVHALVDTSPRHILQELAAAARRWSVELGRPLTLIAESDLNDPKMITPASDGGMGMDAQWNDDFHHALHATITGEADGYYADFVDLSSLVKVTTHGFFHDGTFSSFRGRPHGAPLDPATPTWRLVVASQTHDQVGNRATGDRPSASLDDDHLAVAAVLTVASPFTPMLFMGEEWGARTPWQFFTAHTDPELAAATVAGRLSEFDRLGWDPRTVPDPQDDTTFARSKLDWVEARRPAHRRLVELHRQLLRFRQARPEYRSTSLGGVSSWCDRARRVVTIRFGGVTVAANLGDQVAIGCGIDGHDPRIVIATDALASIDADGLRLPPHSAAVLVHDSSGPRTGMGEP